MVNHWNYIAPLVGIYYISCMVLCPFVVVYSLYKIVIKVKNLLKKRGKQS